VVQIRASDLAWKRLTRDNESALQQVLNKAIPQKLNTLSSDAKVDIKIAILGYILHLNTFNQLKKLIKYWDLDSNDANKILHAILENYEANLGLKQMVFICMDRERTNTRTNIDKMLKQADMHPANALILQSLPEFNFGSRRAILSRIREKPILMPLKVREDCDALMSQLHSFIAKFVYHKLDFIVRFDKSKQHSDLIGDMVRKGVETYYKVTPFLSPLHRENSVKQSIHNQGMKEISFHTSKKRRRGEQDKEGGFTSTIESITMLDGKIDENAMMNQDWELPFLAVEDDKAIEALKAGASPRKASVIDNLLCQKDVQFENYVRSRIRMDEFKSLEHFYRNQPKRYIECIADYYDIPPISVKTVAYNLYREMQGELINR